MQTLLFSELFNWVAITNVTSQIYYRNKFLETHRVSRLNFQEKCNCKQGSKSFRCMSRCSIYSWPSCQTTSHDYRDVSIFTSAVLISSGPNDQVSAKISKFRRGSEYVRDPLTESTPDTIRPSSLASFVFVVIVLVFVACVSYAGVHNCCARLLNAYQRFALILHPSWRRIESFRDLSHYRFPWVSRSWQNTRENDERQTREVVTRVGWVFRILLSFETLRESNSKFTLLSRANLTWKSK